jgi:hypothetical protein
MEIICIKDNVLRQNVAAYLNGGADKVLLFGFFAGTCGSNNYKP